MASGHFTIFSQSMRSYSSVVWGYSSAMLREVKIHFWLLASLTIISSFVQIADAAGIPDTKIYFPEDNTKFEGTKCAFHSGSQGVCRKLDDCLDSQEPIKPSDLCSFSEYDAVYCCPVDHIIHTDVRFGADSDSTTPNPTRPIQKICEHYYPSKNIQDDKAKSSNQDSFPTPAESYSYLASFGWRGKKNKINWTCVGVVISEKIILTDAKCINSRGSLPDVIGILHKGSRKTFNITSIYIHPDYKESEIYHNIAVVKVVPNSLLSKSIKPVCIWPFDAIPKALLYRMGYTAPDMKQIYRRNATIMENKECSKNFGNNLELPNGITTDIFCSEGADKCEKELGGPIHLHITKGANARPFITGIASTGNYCRGSTPVLYTRITSYLDWIEPFLNRDI